MAGSAPLAFEYEIIISTVLSILVMLSTSPVQLDAESELRAIQNPKSKIALSPSWINVLDNPMLLS